MTTIPASASSSIHPIPTISIRQSDRDLSEAILDACTGAGFFYLTDYPIDHGLIERTWKASEDLFLTKSEDAMREKMATRDREGNLGYIALLEEKLSLLEIGEESVTDSIDLEKAKKKDGNIVPGDLKEGFHLQRYQSGKPQQKLPPFISKHENTFGDFIEGCVNTCTIIQRALALALGLEANYFVHRHNAIDDRLRLLHYPPVDAKAAESGNIRAGSHSDYGTITLLFQRDISGLQVQGQSSDGSIKWIDVEPKRDAIVVNVADALEFWTSGLFRSTQHRVVMPRNADEAVSRFSM